MALCHEPKICQRLHAPGLRGLAWRIQEGERIKGQRASNNMVAAQTIMLDQDGDEVDSLKNFKEHPWIFAYNGIICSYRHPIIMVEARKKYLKGL